MKEEEVVLVTRTPLEGTYKGSMSLKCNGFDYDIDSPVTIQISAFNGEEASVMNDKLGIGKAYSGNNYYSMIIQAIDVNDCGQQVSLELQATGTLKGDSLIENGTFILYHNSKKYNGTFHTKSVKQSKY